MTSRTEHGGASDVTAPDGDLSSATAPGAQEPDATGDGPGAAVRRPRPAGRGGAVSAVALITAIAVAVAAATIIWARASASGAGDATSTAAPRTLAGGRTPPTTPDAVAGAIGMPVVMAQRLDDPGAIAATCDLEDAQMLASFVTPDHALVLALTDTPPIDANVMSETASGGPVHVTCVAAADGAGWQHIGSAAVARDGAPPAPPAWLCCDAQGRASVHHVVPVQPDAAWLLEDAVTHAVAYDVTGIDTAGIISTANTNGTVDAAHVWWVDGDGAIVGEAYLGE